ncbi:MAG: tRNA-uridine 2-sulfurtransferase [Patescibacteria group bacterium]|nr:tRNA-uridine 2-sulfurtransferase [Patescibacteria group bacterium]
MSGGVDSSVSAFLLKKAGADVTGVFIKTWQPDYIECTWKEDRLDAMRVCADLDIPFLTLDLEKEYKENVIDYFLEEYSKNRVPNPDIMCNKYIKFDAFLNYAKKEGAVIATGHYAKILDNTLVIPKDQNKDQTYFLYQIDKNNLNQIIFPLADLDKNEVRAIAKANNIFVADKKDSQGICMLGGDVSVKDFLIRELNLLPGLVKDDKGDVIGTHDGVQLYTLGERHGFEITAKDPGSKPFFVYQKDLSDNVLYVTNYVARITNLNQKDIKVEQVNLFENIEEDKEYQIRTRYRGELYTSLIKSVEGGINIQNKNIMAVPGQSLVIYDNEKVVGGGVIN